MKNPKFKCDIEVSAADISDAFSSFGEFLNKTIQQALVEADVETNDVDIPKIVDESAFIRFEVKGIPFRIKVN